VRLHNLVTLIRMWKPILLSIIFVVLIYFIYKMQPTGKSIRGIVLVQGLRIRASLDEIFNKIIPSQKIDITQILSNNTIVWSSQVQLNLASTYYDINVYTLIIRTPQEVSLDNLQTYQNEIEQRLEYLLKRPYIVISLTDVNGNDINNVVQYSLRSFYILVLGILVITTGLYLYVKIAKNK